MTDVAGGLTVDVMAAPADTDTDVFDLSQMPPVPDSPLGLIMPEDMPIPEETAIEPATPPADVGSAAGDEPKDPVDAAEGSSAAEPTPVETHSPEDVADGSDLTTAASGSAAVDSEAENDAAGGTPSKAKSEKRRSRKSGTPKSTKTSRKLSKNLSADSPRLEASEGSEPSEMGVAGDAQVSPELVPESTPVASEDAAVAEAAQAEPVASVPEDRGDKTDETGAKDAPDSDEQLQASTSGSTSASTAESPRVSALGEAIKRTGTPDSNSSRSGSLKRLNIPAKLIVGEEVGMRNESPPTSARNQTPSPTSSTSSFNMADSLGEDEIGSSPRRRANTLSSAVKDMTSSLFRRSSLRQMSSETPAVSEDSAETASLHDPAGESPELTSDDASGRSRSDSPASDSSSRSGFKALRYRVSSGRKKEKEPPTPTASSAPTTAAGTPSPSESGGSGGGRSLLRSMSLRRDKSLRRSADTSPYIKTDSKDLESVPTTPGGSLVAETPVKRSGTLGRTWRSSAASLSSPSSARDETGPPSWGSVPGLNSEGPPTGGLLRARSTSKVTSSTSTFSVRAPTTRSSIFDSALSEQQLPSPTTLEAMTPDELKAHKRAQARNYVARELLVTERNYVNSLQLTVEHMVQPLVKLVENGRPVLTESEIKTIFASIEEVLKVNKEFLEDLEKASETPDNVGLGAAFVKHFSEKDAYVKYGDYYSAAKNAIRRVEESSPTYRQFMAQCMNNPELQRQGVSDHLILPIQRVTRYVMLLSDLVKHSPEDHPDYAALTQALANMRKLSSDVNEAKRKEESMTKMFHIQKTIENCPPTIISASRRYATEDDFFLMDGGTAVRDIRAFLFTDLILLARGPPQMWTIGGIANQSMAAIAARKKRFKFHRVMPLRTLQVVEVDLAHKPGPVFKLIDTSIKGEKGEVVLQAYNQSSYVQFTTALHPLIKASQQPPAK